MASILAPAAPVCNLSQLANAVSISPANARYFAVDLLPFIAVILRIPYGAL